MRINRKRRGRGGGAGETGKDDGASTNEHGDVTG
jgi:hypothetical protein